MSVRFGHAPDEVKSRERWNGMPSPVALYQREMHKNLGFFATWLPGDQLELGEAGVLKGGRFRKQSSLAELHSV